MSSISFQVSFIAASLLRYLYNNISIDMGLAAEAGCQRQAFCLIKHVILFIFHLREVLHPLFDNDVAGGACAIAAAVMFQGDIMPQGDLKDRLPLLTFNGYIQRLEGD